MDESEGEFPAENWSSGSQTRIQIQNDNIDSPNRQREANNWIHPNFFFFRLTMNQAQPKVFFLVFIQSFVLLAVRQASRDRERETENFSLANLRTFVFDLIKMLVTFGIFPCFTPTTSTWAASFLECCSALTSHRWQHQIQTFLVCRHRRLFLLIHQIAVRLLKF